MLHVVPVGLFGELIIKRVFFFPIDFIFFSNSLEDGNQLFSLDVLIQWILFFPIIAWGSYETQLVAYKIIFPLKATCINNIASLEPGVIKIFSFG